MEADQARRRSISYRTALSRLSNIREAYSNAKPYSCALIAFGAAFRYKQGVLCYLDGNHVRFLDIHCWSKREQVIDVKAAIDHTAQRTAIHSSKRFTLPKALIP